MSTRLRLLLLAVAVSSCVAASGVSRALGSPGLTLPNPCTAISATKLSAAFGLPAGSTVTGSLKSQTNNGMPYMICTFSHGAAKLQVEVAPKAFGEGGFGGPPGMVISTPPGFGAKARLITDTNPKFAFSSLSFFKGAFWGEVWTNGKVSAGQVTALAHLLYTKL